MALADPQSVTVSATPYSMPRTGLSPTSGSFQTNDGAYMLDISHVISKRNAHSIRLTATKTVADPMTPSNNTVVTMSTWLGVNVPKQGYTAAEAKAVVDGFVALLAASSGAIITKVLGSES